MDDLVTKLSTPGKLPSHTEECKAIRELDKQSKTLPGRITIDLAMEDIVDGRCGPQVMIRLDAIQPFYNAIRKELGARLRRCGT